MGSGWTLSPPRQTLSCLWGQEEPKQAFTRKWKSKCCGQSGKPGQDGSWGTSIPGSLCRHYDNCLGKMKIKKNKKNHTGNRRRIPVALGVPFPFPLTRNQDGKPRRVGMRTLHHVQTLCRSGILCDAQVRQCDRQGASESET